MALRNSALAAVLFASSATATPAPSYTRDIKSTEKRGFRAPVHHYRPTIKRDTGAVVADFNGGGWILPVLLGGQQILLNIDTGSSDLWTASTLMPADQQSSVTSGYIFDPTKSSTFQYMNGSTYNISYVDGSGASGPVGIDSVNLGGAIVPSMPFGVCDSLRYGGGGSGTRDKFSMNLANNRVADGPVGLGFGQENSIRPSPQCTFMECLEPYVPDPIFSTKFKSDSTGFVDFGYSDNGQYTGDLTTIRIDNSTGQWNANGVQFGSGGTVFPNSNLDGLDFDSGTPTLSIPAPAASAYFDLISGSTRQSDGTYTYPCGSSLPDFDFVFSNVDSGPTTVTIPGANLKNGDGSGTCYTWISVIGDGGYGNAGIPFYISEYIIWNQAIPNLSFATQT